MVGNFKDFLQHENFVETDDTLNCSEQQEEVPDPDQPTEETAEPEEVPYQDYGRYRGFLHIKCSHCGEIKSFCAKKPITGYFCKNCKKFTDLDDLKPLWTKCTCGGYHKYLTNLEDKLFDMECPDCGKFIAMEYDSKRKVYRQIQEDE